MHGPCPPGTEGWWVGSGAGRFPRWDPASPQDSLWSPLLQVHVRLLLDARPGDSGVLFHLPGEETHE